MMLLDGLSMVQNELQLPKIIREFRCDDLDTPHAYISTKAACDQKWRPLKRIGAQKAPFGPWWLEMGSNMCNQAHKTYFKQHNSDGWGSLDLLGPL